MSEKEYLKKRVDIRCSCKKQRPNNDRMKFGTCRCDSYNMSSTLTNVIANYLYQYLADAKGAIIREDWDIIEKCANDIREYSLADSWDLLSKEKGIKTAYIKKEKDFKNAINWMLKNWQSLWW